MYEINDHLRLVRHQGREGNFWSLQERFDDRDGSFKRSLWKPVGALLSDDQAQSWLYRARQSQEPRPRS